MIINIKIVRFLGHIIDVFGTIMILFLTLKQSNNTIWDVIELYIFIICIILNHCITYIMYENLKERRMEQWEKS